MPATQAPADSRAIRERLVEALRLDLFGPRAGHELDAEQLPGRERPSNWYVPKSAGMAEESNDERKAARKGVFPSSISLSFLVPAACRELAVTVRWGRLRSGRDRGGGWRPAITGVAVPRMVAPPPVSANPAATPVGIGAWRFPEWFVAQEADPGDRLVPSRRSTATKCPSTRISTRAGCPTRCGADPSAARASSRPSSPTGCARFWPSQGHALRGGDPDIVTKTASSSTTTPLGWRTPAAPRRC